MLLVRSEFVDAHEALVDLLPQVPPEELMAWVRRGDGLVGWGHIARSEFSGPRRFDEASAWWRQHIKSFQIDDSVRLPGSGPLAFGSFSFSESESSVLIIPRVILGRREGRTWVTWIGQEPETLTRETPNDREQKVTWHDGALSPVQWQAAVAWTVSRIQSGDVDKVVLARDITAESDSPFDVRRALKTLSRDYDSTWTFSVDGLIGATPELLLRLTRGLVTSRVLAGTIRRSGDDQRDLALAASLARSSKDLEEHEYAVESVAQSLLPFCSSINRPEVPFVLHLANVMHLATDVTGVLADSMAVRDAFNLLQALHPSAAVCGTPTPAAYQLINEVEGMSRGRYAGPVGWIDARGDGEWGIALRCAQINGKRARLFAGCGIVAGSDPEAEYAESQAKLIPMRTALAEGQSA